MPYSIDQNITGILQQEYPEQFVSLKNIAFKGTISLFVIGFNTENELEERWDKFSGLIAAYYQSRLENEFSKWNIYVVYICAVSVKLSLKYKIENDRFSSRKILIDNFDQPLNDVAIDDIIKAHITNKDISFSAVGPPEQHVYTSDSHIWDLIKNAKLKTGKSGTQETEALLKQIETKLNED